MAGQLNHLSLKIDTDSMIRDLISRCTERATYVAENLTNSLNGMPFEFASGTFKQELIKSSEDAVQVRVGTNHWYAYIVEYGRGSMLDKNNPFLGEYIISPYYNPYRSSDFAIRSRKGEYTIPDWEGGSGFITRIGGGQTAKNLETLSPPDPRFAPSPPRHFFKKAMENSKRVLEQEILNTMKTFPYHKYLKGGV